MAHSGKNASFSFAGVVYDADDCLQGWDLSQAVSDVIYQCNGYDKHAAGTQAVTFRTSLALAKTDTTRITAFTPGTTGAFEGHPGGDTAGYIEAETVKATVLSANVGAPMNGFIAIDLELGIDDITWGASTS